MTTPTLEERIREILDKYTDNPMSEDNYYNKGQSAIVTEVMEAIQAAGYRQTNHFEQVNMAADDKGVLYPAMKRGEWKKVAQDNGYLTEAEWRAKAEQEGYIQAPVLTRRDGSLYRFNGREPLKNGDEELLLTGSEWLSRFEREAEKLTDYTDAAVYFDEFLEAARRAAGLQE